MWPGRVKSFLYSTENLVLKARVENPLLGKGKTRAVAGGFFGAVMMRPPGAPGVGISAKRGSRDDVQGRVDQVLRRGVQRIVIQKIEKLGNSCEALFPGEHAGSRKITGRALTDSGGVVIGRDQQERCG